MEWTGFTDEELRRLKGQNTGQRESSRPRSQGMQKARMAKQTAQNVKTGKQKQVAQKYISTQSSTTEIQPSMLLSEPALSTQTKSTNVENEENDPPENELSNKPTARKDASQEIPKDAAPDPDKVLGKELDEKEFLERELSNVDKFQIQQKIMEEQNKKKQELLSIAIVERQRRAKAEASKLVKIQREVAALDRSLHADVTIIRDKIEEASREFLEAQKRYERAEQEFVEAKMDLHRKSEVKESLTEHLYTIIHQNEIRKAKKLTELMEKLQLDGGEEPNPVHIELSGLPSMTLLNAIQTLEPNSPTSPTSKQKETTADGSAKRSELQENGTELSPKGEHNNENPTGVQTESGNSGQPCLEQITKVGDLPENKSCTVTINTDVGTPNSATKAFSVESDIKTGNCPSSTCAKSDHEAVKVIDHTDHRDNDDPS